jgi:hypothetical protein
MANTIRIKRRATGSSGAPASLKNAELAFNEVDQVLYYGKGADGSGNATSVIAIGGVGWDAMADLSNYGELTAASQTWTGTNEFSGTVNVSTFQLSSSTVTATAAELNVLSGITASTAELNILDGVTADYTELNVLDGITASTAELNILDGVTADYAELNVLDGITASTAELNVLDGITASTAELNILDGVTADYTELNVLDGITASTAELNILDGVTADHTELNLLDGATAGTVVNSKVVVYGSAGAVAVTSLSIGGTSVTATATELNVLDGITASTSELNILDGVTADSAELNLLDGAAANTVVNSKVAVYGSSGELSAASISTTGNGTVGGNLTVTGDLTVSGTTVTVNAETVEVEDKNIVLGKVATPTDATADGGGLTLKGATDKEFKWVDSTDAWTSSEHVALAAGKDLMMSGATSGKVTVVVADVAGSNTITLPANTGTVVLDSTVCSAISSCELDGGSF